MKNFRLPKWMVVALAAAVFLPLVADWVAPGTGTRLAAEWLGARGVAGETRILPLWGWLVGLAGKDVAALGWVSVCAGLVCVWLVTAIIGSIFGVAIRLAKADGAAGENEFPFVESAAILLAGLGFALTPGFLAAATRISPLMVALVPPLAALALAVGVVTGPGTLLARLAAGKGRLFLAVLLGGYSACELVLARRVFPSLAFPALGVWIALGVMPALVIAWCVRKRWLLGRKAFVGAFGGWALVIVVMGATNFTLGKLVAGRVAGRIVSRIIANAEESGKVAVVSDGTLDDLFYFMLPRNLKQISVVRERDPAYGRELNEWLKGERRLAAGVQHQALGTNQVADLAFAAELGPRALIDEWTKLDKAGFEAAVSSIQTHFPTREKWDEARGELKGMRSDEPLAEYLRHFLGVCGNALGCAMLERGDKKGAWSVFKTVVDEVEPKNYGAYLNLLGMVERGYAASKEVVDDLKQRRQQIEKDLKGWDRIVRAARSSGRLYADPGDVAKYEKMKREAAAKRELSPEAKAFVETVAAAPKDPKSGKTAQEAIRKAIREGMVQIDKIGGHLITIDFALGDFENVEKDSIDVLKVNRHDPTANAALGMLAGYRGDHKRAEQYLRRAISTGAASIAAKNALAWSLYRQGRLDEAEPFAREAVKGYGEAWAIRETLAAILIRKGKIEEGERELVKAEELAEKAGVPKGKIVSLEIDRARLMKAKGDMAHYRTKMRTLRRRKDLDDDQKAEIKEMDK